MLNKKLGGRQRSTGLILYCGEHSLVVRMSRKDLDALGSQRESLCANPLLMAVSKGVPVYFALLIMIEVTQYKCTVNLCQVKGD